MIRETRLIFITLNDIFFWSFIVFDRFQSIMAVHGCITILKGPKTKTSICTSFQTHFTRIPEKFPDFVAELIIEHQNITTLDSSQLDQLPHLLNLTIKNSGIMKIVPNSFLHVPQLISLRLSGNRIYLKESSMPSSSLIYLKNIHVLDLSHNPIGFVPDYYFQLLKQLKFLNLSSADKGFYIETNGFYGLTNLQVLDLTNNRLATLSESLFHSLSAMQLQEFYLYHNSWNCDCNLQWLKTWFSTHKSVKYSREINKELSSTGVNLAGEMQPKCTIPYFLSEKNLLSDSTSGESVRISDLKCAPKIFTQDRKVEITKEQNVTFSCDFHANPGGLITWSKNGMIVQNHWRRVSWNRSQGVKFKAWLTVENVEESDNGNWKCILTTKVSKVNATFTLKVISPPSNIDLKSILKYVGIGAVTLILLLVVIGIIIYCVYGFQIQHNRRPNKSSSNVLIDTKDSTLKQNHTNYHVISKGGKEGGFTSNIIVSPLDKGQYYNPTIMASNTSYIQPCLEQSHSPFSHYLVNGSSSICPLHGEVMKQKSTKPDDDPNNDIKNIQIPLKESNIAQNCATPCPIHGDVLSYLSCPVSSIATTSHSYHSPSLSSSAIGKPSKEYVLRVTSQNPVAVTTSDSLSPDMKYLSSGPATTTFSFSTAI